MSILQLIDHVEKLVRDEIKQAEWHDLPSKAARTIILPPEMLDSEMNDMALGVIAVMFEEEGWEVEQEANILSLREDARSSKRNKMLEFYMYD